MDIRIYNSIIKEYFDISDRETRRDLISLSEAEQNQKIISLSSKLYAMIIAKVDEVDFGKIPESKGDITKIPNYQELNECLTTIRNLLIEYKQSTKPADIIFETLEHMKTNKAIWEKAFVYDSQIGKALYNTISLSVVTGVSFLISGCIDFIKDPSNESFQAVLDVNGYHKSKDNLIFKNLEKINKSFKQGDMQKAIKSTLEANKTVREYAIVDEVAFTPVLVGSIVAMALAAPAIITLILPAIQELVSLIFCVRQNISDYWSIQSDLVRMNAENVRLSVTKTESERDKIYKKQIKIANNFKKISNKLTIKIKSSENEAIKMAAKDRKTNFKSQDVQNAIPSIF